MFIVMHDTLMQHIIYTSKAMKGFVKPIRKISISMIKHQNLLGQEFFYTLCVYVLTHAQRGEHFCY